MFVARDKEPAALSRMYEKSGFQMAVVYGRRCVRNRGRSTADLYRKAIRWGTDPKTREQADIDAMAANRNEKRVFVGECKWRNRFDWAEAARVLEHRAQLLKGFNEQSLCLFTKNRLNESAVDELRVKGVKTVCAEDLYV